MVSGRSSRATDIAARHGGEEITIVLPSTNRVGAIDVAERIQSAIDGLQITHEANPEGADRVSANVGVATALSRQGVTMRMPESLLMVADNALYKEKREEQNRVATALLVALSELYAPLLSKLSGIGLLLLSKKNLSARASRLGL